MADFDHFDFGSLTFPLAAQASGTSLLAVCDPALSKILDYLAFEIDAKLGAAMTGALAAGTPPVGANIRKKLSIEPVIEYVKADQLKFPLFCVWRDESKHSDRTFNWRQDVHVMGWCYVLPAMTLEWADKFSHVLHAVVGIVNYSLHQGFDPGYNASERVIGSNSIASARCLGAKYGLYKLGSQTDTLFHAVFGELEVVEQSEPNLTGLTDLLGTDFTVTQQERDDVATVIAGDVSIGATSLLVASSTGFAALDVVEIAHGTAREEFVSIVSIPDATHLVIGSPGLVFAHTAVQADVVDRSPVTIVQAASEVGP